MVNCIFYPKKKQTGMHSITQNTNFPIVCFVVH